MRSVAHRATASGAVAAPSSASIVGPKYIITLNPLISYFVEIFDIPQDFTSSIGVSIRLFKEDSTK